MKPTIVASGKLDKVSYNELKVWVNNKQTVTGDLLRLSFSDLSNIEAGSNFKKISASSVKDDEMVVSISALPLIEALNKQAKSKKVKIKINQAVRMHGVKVTGAVVAPASKSQHLIGHAIDCNIVDGDNWNNSMAFKTNKASNNAKNIIKELKKSGYRWGGDFNPTDPVHFDNKLTSSGFGYEAKFFLNQRMISENHPIPKSTTTQG